jgi:Type II restriction endonuclease EcoO109I
VTPEQSSQIRAFLSQHIEKFHGSRIEKIQAFDLTDILKRKNPYLLRTQNFTDVSLLISSLLDATIFASEEGKYGHFLEALAIFINQMVYGGQKSSSTGLDLEFTRDGVRYLVAIKSGPNWGNSDQYKSLKANFKAALKVLRQSASIGEVRPVLGICYGKCRNTDDGEYLKLCGQAFWEFISGDRDLYVALVEPIGFEAEQHMAQFLQERANAHARLVHDFTHSFCHATGQIDWDKLIRFNSGSS